MGFFHRAVSCLAMLLLACDAQAEDIRTNGPVAQGQSNTRSAEDDIFAKLLVQYQGLTYDQLKAGITPHQYLTHLSFDPTSVKYFDKVANGLKLNDEEQAIFKRNGFVSVDHDQRYSFASAYYAIYAGDLPVLITTDSILHALHSSYDAILFELETMLFSPTLEGILAACHEELAKLVKQNPTPELLDSYHDVDLYLTVARNLLLSANAAVATPRDPYEAQENDDWNGELRVKSLSQQDAQVLEILRLIRSLTLQTPGLPPTIIYGRPRYIDYSQFRPRGRYTKSVVLKRYFRTMMWLGRADCGWDINTNRELRNAVLLAEVLTKTNSVKRLQTLDEILTVMVGRSDNLRVFDLLKARQGQKVATLNDVADPAVLGALRHTLLTEASGYQRIRSQVVESDRRIRDTVLPPELFQMFGQRFAMDSFILSKVVYDEIHNQEVKVERYLPTGLDVMAALGNSATIPLLADELKKYPYSANLKASQVFVSLYDPEFWHASLYNIWLDALRTLDDNVTQPQVPQIMRTQTWQLKQLQTQLASWAELRHDTVLYAKQSYTANVMCEYPTGYVEPYPQFYAKIQYFAEQTLRLFQNLEFLSPNVDSNDELSRMKARQLAFLNTMNNHLSRLEQLAQKELAAQPFTAEEQGFLKKIIDARGVGSGAPRYDGWYCDLFYGGQLAASAWYPTVTDVHTDPNARQVLQIGVGDANFLMAAIDNESDRMVYVGPIFSYYEFTQPVSQRLTDEVWQGKISTNIVPARPGWTSAFQGPREKRGFGTRSVPRLEERWEMR